MTPFVTGRERSVPAALSSVWAGCSWTTRQTVATEIRWPLAIWCRVCPRSVYILLALRSSSRGFLPTCRPSTLARHMPALTLSTIRLRSSSAIASVCVQSGDVLIGNPKVYPALVEFALRSTIRSQRQQKNRVSQLRKRMGRLNPIRWNTSSDSRRDGRTLNDRHPGQLTLEFSFIWSPSREPGYCLSTPTPFGSWLAPHARFSPNLLP